MKKLTSTSFLFIPAGLCLLFCLLANYASAAVLYFDPTGTTAVTAGTYTWDTVTAEWSTSSALTGSLVVWNSTDAANFCAGSFSGNITVMVNSAINDAGLFDGNLTPPGCNLTLAGSGSINLAGGGAQAWGSGGSDGNSVTMNIPITGAGSQPESEMAGVNNLYLYAPNSYTGGFVLGSTSNGGTPPQYGVDFNNSQSFGIGGNISSTSASAQRNILTPLAAQTAGPLVLLQGLTLWNGVFSYSGVALAPVTFQGGVTLSTLGNTSTLQIQSTTDVGAGTATLTLSGNISGAGNLAKTGAGVLVLSGANNTYIDSTTITAGTLQLGIGNTILTTSSLVMNGGTFNPGGFGQYMTASTLGLTAGSTIDFSAGASTLEFANSHSLTWSGVLDLHNWVFGTDALSFGVGGLTSAQLADIEFDDNPATEGTAQLDANGFVIVPEPSTAILGLLGGLSLLWSLRRRTA